MDDSFVTGLFLLRCRLGIALFSFRTDLTGAMHAGDPVPGLRRQSGGKVLADILKAPFAAVIATMYLNHGS
ncbi:hypothetical protein [Rhizobium sp. SYY.PMSO]|uniref:hypothetical protein n=1 Tax=Rhizobium sp. SYY.PMSO TaxID=3382192 RepID=UPI0039900EC6